jgi:hypothetical protein
MTNQALKHKLALHGHTYRSSLLLPVVLLALLAVGVVMGRVG